MIVSFCGHHDVLITEKLRAWLTQTICTQIEAGANIFYLGGYGNFDHLAASTLHNLVRKYPAVSSCLVLAYPNSPVSAELYDFTVYPELEHVPPRFAISHRNQWIVEQSQVLICCVDHRWGGAYAMMNDAKKKGKEIINYCDF